MQGVLPGRWKQPSSRIEELPMADLDPITPLIPIPPVPRSQEGRGRPERRAPRSESEQDDVRGEKPGVRPDGSVDEYA